MAEWPGVYTPPETGEAERAQIRVNRIKAAHQIRRDEQRKYAFLLDFVGNDADPKIASVLAAVEKEAAMYKFLGCYSEAAAGGAAKLEKGSADPLRKKVGKVTKAQVKEIAEKKMPDLNAKDIEGAMRIIEGTARQMGITIEG